MVVKMVEVQSAVVTQRGHPQNSRLHEEHNLLEMGSYIDAEVVNGDCMVVLGVGSVDQAMGRVVSRGRALQDTGW